MIAPKIALFDTTVDEQEAALIRAALIFLADQIECDAETSANQGREPEPFIAPDLDGAPIEVHPADLRFVASRYDRKNLETRTEFYRKGRR